MISMKQLTYALAVEKTLHFKNAAELCHVSQSALSTALTALEKQLGLQIFERDNKKVLVTPPGKEALARARTILLQVEDLQHLADSQKAPLSFPLSVGIIPTIAPYLLPKMFPVLHKQFPDSEVRVAEEQSQTLVNMVRHGEIDTAILALPYPCDGLLTLEFWKEDFYWITHKDNEHAQKKEMTGNQIKKNTLMLLKEGHCLKEHVLDVCKLPKNSTKNNFDAASLSTLVQMVQINLGTTLIPNMAREQLINSNSTLSAIHLNEPSPHRRIAFILRPNYTRLSSIEALIDVCKEALVQ